MTQRMLSPEEYAALGYVQRLDFDESLFQGGSYSSFTVDLNPFDFAYRAEEKQDYYVDVGFAMAKIGYSALTGGIVPATRTALTVFLDLVR